MNLRSEAKDESWSAAKGVGWNHGPESKKKLGGLGTGWEAEGI